MHTAGFSHGQLFWRNILVRLGLDGMPELFVLDAQPKPAWRRWVRGGTWWHDELAHLLVSALPFARRTERLRLLRAYFGTPRLGREYKQHVREITAAAQGWSRHEKQRIKMNHLFDQWNAELDRELRNLEQPAAFRARVAGAGPLT